MWRSLACVALATVVSTASGQTIRCGAGTVSVEVEPGIFECQTEAIPPSSANVAVRRQINPKMSTSGGNVTLEVPAEGDISLKVGEDEVTFAGIREAIGSVASAHRRIDDVEAAMATDAELAGAQTLMTTNLANLRTELVDSLSVSVEAAESSRSAAATIAAAATADNAAGLANIAAGRVSIQLPNQTVGICTNDTVGTLMYNTTMENVMLCKAGPKWEELSKVPLGSSEQNPADGCTAVQTDDPNAASGNYYLRGSNGMVASAYCEMDKAGGGWTHIASMKSSGATWQYYNARWTNTARVDGAGVPFDGQNVDRKTAAYSNAPMNEVLFTNADGSKWHHMHEIVGHGSSSYTSFRELIRSGYYLWGKKAASAGGAPWNYPNWAFNNVEFDDDRCWDGRINVMMQLPPDGHTGAGTFFGVACGGGNANARNYYGGDTTYRAVNSGYKAMEPYNLRIEDPGLLNIFVRNRNPFQAASALGSRPNPAQSCKAIKAANSAAPSGVYWLSRGSAYRVYCEMTISGGGWTHIMSVWDTNNNDWRYYNARWTNTATINPGLMGDVHTAKLNRKMGSYMDQPFREFLVSNEDGAKWHHGNNCLGVNRLFPSFRAMIQNGNRWTWYNRAASSGHTMWNYGNWAFNNVEPGSDQCWNARINVCKQTSGTMTHTGGGGWVGGNCQGRASSNPYNFAQQRMGSTTYRCANGYEPKNLAIDTDTKYINVWVRE